MAKGVIGTYLISPILNSTELSKKQLLNMSIVKMASKNPVYYWKTLVINRLVIASLPSKLKS